MSKKQKLAELARRKAALETKIAAITEAKRTGSLAFLIEDAVQSAEVLLVAKSVVDKLQKMAEEIAKIEGSDIIPAMEGLKAAYGPGLADQFQQVASENLRNTVAAITQAKDAVSASVSKFESALNGEPTNDMGMDAAPIDPAADAGAPMNPAGLEGDAEAAADDEMDADAPLDADADDAALDDIFSEPETGPAAGRARKESAVRKGKPLAETVITDETILRAFRAALRESKGPVPAARAVAKHFSIDFADVAMIVKESSRLGK